jgi:guanylate kinase
MPDMNADVLQDVVAPFFQVQLIDYRAGKINAEQAMRCAVAFILCGRSGAGKDTLRAHLLTNEPRLGRVITTTTRQPENRGGQMETHGKDYFFVSPAEFDAGWKKGDLLERDAFAGNHYGCSVEGVLVSLAFGKIPILQITGRGVQAVLPKFDNAERSRGVFVSATRQTVCQRLVQRATQTSGRINKQSINRRLDEGDEEEQQFRPMFDLPFGEVVVNESLEAAQRRILQIVQPMVGYLVGMCQQQITLAQRP